MLTNLTIYIYIYTSVIQFQGNESTGWHVRLDIGRFTKNQFKRIPARKNLLYTTHVAPH